jgi:drug/metabolite transporter (DMT)-like permease
MMQIIGITCSAAAALFWSVAIILFKKSSDNFSPMALNLFKCTVTLVLLIPTLLLCGIDLFPDKPAYDWIMFCVSGFLGIALADTFFFMALSRLGTVMTAIVDCLYLPIVIFISFVFLDEMLGIKGLFGATLVVIAIFIGSVTKKGISVTGIEFFIGMVLGILAITLIAGSIVMLKRLLEDTNVLWASFARVLAGTLGLYLIVLLSPARKRLLAELYPSKTWFFALPASVAGNYFAMIAWLAGMKYTMVSVAAILNQLSTVFIFILAAIFLKEPVTLPRVSATLLAVSGTILATMSVH